jgi:1-acyl-sn-glycerol-3-phosphate acyltransferase
VLAPLVLAFALLVIVCSPMWLLVAAVCAPFVAGWLRPIRVAWLVTAYLLVEAIAITAMFGMWVASGFGWKVRGPAFQRAHYRLCGRLLRVLYRQAKWVLRLTVEIGGAIPDVLPVGRPLVLLSRHAGPGDSFLLVHALINWYGREPRIVLKSALQWDPAIDILLNRLPSRFIVPGSGQTAAAQIRDLATGLDDDDALVIFPEGGNFTPERWRRGIERLHRLGLHKMARRAAEMRNVLPPHPGGVIAALDASPRATVVLVGHTGVDHMRTAGDVWRELPMDKIIMMHWWLDPPEDVPVSEEARIEWLYGWWARIDEWISQTRPELPVPDGRTVETPTSAG